MHRKLGPSGPDVSTVIYGAWQAGGWWWGASDDDEQVRAMHAAFDAGIDTVDTAPVYGFGHSEDVVGKAIRGRSGIKVLTKCGLHWTGPEGAFFFDTDDGRGGKAHVRRWSGNIERECEQSLRRLGVDAIDVLQLHWPEPGIPPEAVMDQMNRLLDAGKIKAIGVSNCSADWMRAAKARGPLTVHQPRWSWIFRAEENGSLAWSRDNDVAAIVYSPLAQGLLSGRITPETTFAPGDERAGTPAFRPEYIRQVQAINESLRGMAADKGCTLSQLALASTLEEPGITGVIVGARNAAQAVENAAAMHVHVSDDERAEIRRRFSTLPKP